jgi:UDP-N-acetyl-D-mannosaminuronic acid dehydrogenase
MPDSTTQRPFDVFIIGGCGHVGLPLGIMLAKAGLNVGLWDLDQGRRAAVAEGRMPFLEYDAEPILAETLGRTLHVVESDERLGEAEWLVVTVGTPVDEYLNPAFGPLFQLADTLAPKLRPGQHLVMRSTIYPGMMSELYNYFATAGVDVELSYCPERIVQGYAISELDRLPQIVSAFTDEAREHALQLFGRLTDRLIVASVEEAELAKLYLNAWRYIQFAIANQFYVMAEGQGVDFFRVHEVMTTGYDRASDFPLPGFTAGPCLLKDTMQLAAFSTGGFPLGHAAMQVNEGLANFVVDRLHADYDLRNTTVGILGMAFKADIDDIRDSLAYKLRKILNFRGATVICADHLVPDSTFVSAEALLAQSDVVVIGAPHRQYRELLEQTTKPVVDVWGFVRRGAAAELGSPTPLA